MAPRIRINSLLKCKQTSRLLLFPCLSEYLFRDKEKIIGVDYKRISEIRSFSYVCRFMKND